MSSWDRDEITKFHLMNCFKNLRKEYRKRAINLLLAFIKIVADCFRRMNMLIAGLPDTTNHNNEVTNADKVRVLRSR